jgi:hypothetical protein
MKRTHSPSVMTALALTFAGHRFVRQGSMLLIAAISMPAHAAGAHVHGVATLQVAVESGRLTLDFASPLDNLVGFEHAPRTDKQKSAIRQMAERLHKPELLFVPAPEARCAPASVNLQSPVIPASLLSADPRAQQTSPDASRDAPKRSSKGSKDAHASISAEIVFRCERPESLSGLEVKLFDAFPNTKRLDAQVAGPKKQTAARLTPRNRRLSW